MSNVIQQSPTAELELLLATVMARCAELIWQIRKNEVASLAHPNAGDIEQHLLAAARAARDVEASRVVSSRLH